MPPGVPRGWQRHVGRLALLSRVHQQAARSEVEQQDRRCSGRWDASVTGGSFTHGAKAGAPT